MTAIATPRAERTRLHAGWFRHPDAPIYAAIALGVLIRAAHVLPAAFPLTDGGMFYVMSNDVRAAHNSLPLVTSYNGAGIPFAYSPLGFFLAAALNTVGIPMLALLRWIPLVAASLLIVAFSHLARTLLRERTATIAAVVAFAVLPRSFAWLIMGGGLTRSLGLLFAVIALHQMLLFYTRQDWRFAATAAVACALTVLSHLSTASWLVWSIALLFVFYGRHRRGIIGSVVVGGATVLLTGPWWSAVLAAHGPGPFQAARTVSGSIFDPNGRYAAVTELLSLFYNTGGEPFFPLVGVLGSLGVFAALRPGLFILPAWWVLTFATDARAGYTYGSVPLAMLAGVGVADVLLPALRACYGRGLRQHAAVTTSTDAPRSEPHPIVERLLHRVPALVLGGMVAFGTGAALWHHDFGGGEPRILVPLSPGQREAMHWVASHVPADGSFLVVTGQLWSSDKVTEWFPALTGRRSIGTLQGREWFPGFNARLQKTDAFQARCPEAGTACLTAFADSVGQPFSYVYVSKTGGTRPCCAPLAATLRRDPSMTLLYDSPDAAVFQRRE